MTIKKFNTKIEMISEMRATGIKTGISEEVLNNDIFYTLGCARYKETSCEAAIVGIYNKNEGSYEIRKENLHHNCNKKIMEMNREYIGGVLSSKIYENKRCGEIVTILRGKGYRIEYIDVYRKLANYEDAKEEKAKGSMMSMKERSAMGESMTREQPMSREQSMLRGQSAMSMMTESMSTRESTPMSMKQNSTKIEEECLKHFNEEFSLLNPGVTTKIKKGEFFFKIEKYSETLRNVQEIKIYRRENEGGTVIFGVLWGPDDNPIIQSGLVWCNDRLEALRSFVEMNKPTNYLIEADMDVFENVQAPKFMKTRYLLNSIDSLRSYSSFLNLNYGDVELLNLPKEFYLCKFAMFPLYNLNNTPICDFDFMTKELLSMSFFECINGILLGMEKKLKFEKRAILDLPEHSLSSRALEIFEECCKHEEGCDCGFYSEFLIPCNSKGSGGAPGNFKDNKAPPGNFKGNSKDNDPYLRVSSVYCLDKILELENVHPVVNQ